MENVSYDPSKSNLPKTHASLLIPSDQKGTFSAFITMALAPLKSATRSSVAYLIPILYLHLTLTVLSKTCQHQPLTVVDLLKPQPMPVVTEHQILCPSALVLLIKSTDSPQLRLTHSMTPAAYAVIDPVQETAPKIWMCAQKGTQIFLVVFELPRPNLYQNVSYDVNR